MIKFKLNSSGIFVEVETKVSENNKKEILKETLPAKESFWSKMARFFYDSYIMLKKQIEGNLKTDTKEDKLIGFKDYWNEDEKYKEFFGM